MSVEQEIQQKLTKMTSKSRWKTVEFGFYYVFLFLSFAIPTPWIMERSDEVANSSRWRKGLTPGWIGDRDVDVSDAQYRFFRSNVALLAGIALLHIGIRRGLGISSYKARVLYSALFSIGLLGYTAGSCVAFIAVIIAVNYAIGKFCTPLGKIAPVLTWTFNIAVLLLNEKYRGYRWAELDESLAWLDLHRGMFPWHTLFNLTVLKMISFNMDYYWAYTAKPLTGRDGQVITLNKHMGTCYQCAVQKAKGGLKGQFAACYWWREKTHTALEDFNFLSYFAFLFYVPLHFAGPITTFNAFNSHMHVKTSSFDLKALGKYAFRWIAEFMLMELFLHYIYLFSMTNSGFFAHLTPSEMAISVLETLILMWMKFMLMWRFFRMWALADGVESPENMNRCVCNNFTVQGFWRSWHRSFNRWLVRYVYIPLGGGGKRGVKVAPGIVSGLKKVVRRIFNTFIVFTWVAFWHDRTMQLLAWGWFTVLTFTPELVITAVLSGKKYGPLQQKSWFRHIKAVGAVLNILFLMTANMIGYSVGVQGTMTMSEGIFASNDTIYVMIGVFLQLFSGAQFMFEWREQEVRNALKQDAKKLAELSQAVGIDPDIKHALKTNLEDKLSKTRAYF